MIKFLTDNFLVILASLAFSAWSALAYDDWKNKR